MAESLGTATLELEGNLAPLEKDLASARTKVTSEGNKMGSSFKQSLGSGVKKATLPAIAALGLVAVGVKKTTDAASALGESQNAVNVVFGKASGKLHAFAKIAATEAGLSMRAFNELVTPIGASLINVGMGADEAADASINLAKRAADMASVFNVDVSEAMGAIQAGLRGEADPLERFGVGLSATAVDAKALSMGLGKTTVDVGVLRDQQMKASIAAKEMGDAILKHGKNSVEAQKATLTYNAAQRAVEKTLKGGKSELSAHAKAQARLALLMEQTERTAGDFKNTSGGLANAQRINAAEAENTAASFGKSLMPIMMLYRQALASVMNLLGGHKTATMVLVGVVTGLAAAILLARGAMMVYSTAQAIALAFTNAENAALIAQRVLLAVSVVGALLLVAGALFLLWKKSETFRDITTGAFNKVKAVAGAAAGFIKRHWMLLLAIMGGPTGIVIGQIIKHWGMVKAVGMAAFNAVKAVVGFLIDKIAGPLIGRVIDFIKKVKDVTGGPFDKVKDAIGHVIDKVGAAIGRVGDLIGKIKQMTAGPIGPVISAFKTLAGWIGTAATKMGGLKGAIDRLPNIPGLGILQALGRTLGRNLGEGLKDGLLNSFASLGDAIASGVKGAVDKASARLDPIIGGFQSVAQAAFQAISTGTMPTVEEVQAMVREMMFGADLQALVARLAGGMKPDAAKSAIHAFLNKYGLLGTPYAAVLEGMVSEIAGGSGAVHSATVRANEIRQHNAAMDKWRDKHDKWKDRVTDPGSAGGKSITAEERKSEPDKPRNGRLVNVENLNVRTDVDVDLVASALYRKAKAI